MTGNQVENVLVTNIAIYTHLWYEKPAKTGVK